MIAVLLVFVTTSLRFGAAGASAHSQSSAQRAATSLHVIFPPGDLDSNADLSKCGVGGGYWNWYYCNDPGHPFGCTIGANSTCAEYGVDVYWDHAGATIYAPEAGTATASTCGDFSCWNPGNVTLTPSSGPYRGVIRVGHVSPNFTGTISVQAGQAIATEGLCNDSCGWDPHIEFMYSPTGALTMGAFTGGCTAPANPCGNRPPQDPTSAWSVLVAIENGSGPPPPPPAHAIDDFNGDGASDLAFLTGVNGGTTGSGHLELHGAYGASFSSRGDFATSFAYLSSGTAPAFFADVNGDGKADMCFLIGVNGGTTGSGHLEVHCAYGPNFHTRSDSTTPFAYINTANTIPFFADVNGDGKADMCFLIGVNGGTTGSGHLEVHCAYGPNFHTRSDSTTPFSYINTGDTVVLDAVTIPPSGVGLPAVTGGAVVGKRLSASSGSWTETPFSYSYAWLRCSPSRTKCAPIRGATRRTHRLRRADFGHRLMVRVSALNASGWSTPETSRPTAVVR